MVTDLSAMVAELSAMVTVNELSAMVTVRVISNGDND